MGQAFITRRGGGNGRVAVGTVTPTDNGDTIVVDSVGFNPKQIMLFASVREIDNYVLSVVWNSTKGIIDFNAYNAIDEISVNAYSNGFKMSRAKGYSTFKNDYYWVAFEKEQGV